MSLAKIYRDILDKAYDEILKRGDKKIELPILGEELDIAKEIFLSRKNRSRLVEIGA